MPFGNAVSGPAFGVLNELLGIVRGTDGIARTTRYETLFLPPSGARGPRNAPTNAMAAEMANLTGSNTAREVSLKCDQIEMPVDHQQFQ